MDIEIKFKMYKNPKLYNKSIRNKGIIIYTTDINKSISCLFKIIKTVEIGELIKFKNNHGAIIEADSPANFHFTPKTNVKISNE